MIFIIFIFFVSLIYNKNKDCKYFIINYKNINSIYYYYHNLYYQI